MPQATDPLFTAAELTNWLHRPVSTDAAAIAEVVVWGWLQPRLGIAERPWRPEPSLKAWAIELGGIAVTNPENLASYSLETESTTYDVQRRSEILDAVEAHATGRTKGSVPSPRGNFPPPRRYPDAAERW